MAGVLLGNRGGGLSGAEDAVIGTGKTALQRGCTSDCCSGRVCGDRGVEVS